MDTMSLLKPRRRRREPFTAPPTGRITVHRYPTTLPDTKDYFLDSCPRAILDAAIQKAHAENKSLRVVMIDLLRAYSGIEFEV
jgi:hypothetical protein